MHKKVQDFFRKKDQLGRYLGIRIDEVGEGFSRTSLTLKPELLNGAGIAHGATIFARRTSLLGRPPTPGESWP